MDPTWSTLACPLCGTTLVAPRAQFPEMAHADVVAMNYLQKAMEVHWNRFCAGEGKPGGRADPRTEHAERRLREHGDRRPAELPN